MNENNQKHWWAPVWTGLVMDMKATHCKKIGNAIWLFLYLVLNADRKNGFLKRKIKTICQDMGVNRDTVLRWLKILKEGDYLATVNTGRYLTIHIKKWKSVSGVGKMQLQKLEISDFRGWKNPTSQRGSKDSKTLYTSQKNPHGHLPIDISIKRILNIDNDNRDFISSDFKSKTREELLALDLATALDDLEGLTFYIALSHKYPELFLRDILAAVKGVPLNRIKKSRGALFNHLVKKHSQTN